MDKNIDVEELKQIQLEILDVVDEFCKKHNINYWLDSGTLLGAVRHKGYIPWDDDIDLGMLRPDYEKFMNTFNQENSRYKFICGENDKDCYFPFGKVLDTSTVLYEPTKEKGIKFCVNIDIFIYDNAPDDDRILKKMYFKRSLYRDLNYIQNYPTPPNRGIKGLIKNILSVGLHVFPKRFFRDKMLNNSKKYSQVETKRIGDFTGYFTCTGSKELFKSFINMEFEGKEYPVPIGYEEWLREMYEDYMKLPPEEERVTHHSFVAYKKEDLLV